MLHPLRLEIHLGCDINEEHSEHKYIFFEIDINSVHYL